MNNILNILPNDIKTVILRYKKIDDITEIRLRANRKMHIYYGVQELITDYTVSLIDITNILRNATLNSIYSVQNDINNGFITITGGHRIGIVGEAVLNDGKVKNIKNISSMNIRVAKAHVGLSEKIMDKILVDNKVKNTIIISPPLCGKTTLLRDIARCLSTGGKKTAIVDERGEICSMANGSTTLDIGERTDVISYIPKEIGMQMVVRSMAPEVVITDEIGTKEDACAIKYLCRSGVSFITTIHGDSIMDVYKGDMKELFDEGHIHTVIILSKNNGIGTIENIYSNVNEIINERY